MDGTIFSTTLNQMAFLFLLMAIGFILAKTRVVGESAATALSRLESFLLIPALVTGTFMKQFTVSMLSVTWKLMLGSLVLEAFVIAGSFLTVRLLTKDPYLRKVYWYGLCFANFGFMGNAVISALFPEIFTEYLIFTLVLWMLIDVWGAPSLLMGSAEDDGKPSLGKRIKKLLNPMVIGMLLGMAVGISGVKLPSFVYQTLDSLGNCMSPIAMLISGMILAKIDFKRVLKHGGIYVMTLLRLIVFPLAFFAIAKLFRLPDTFTLLGVAAMAMPIGMNTIVIPTAYGRDAEEASGMVLVSHLLSAVTIPFVFWLTVIWK